MEAAKYQAEYAGLVQYYLLAQDVFRLSRLQTISLGSPRLFHDDSRFSIRPVERQVLRVLDVADFLSLTPAAPSTAASAQSEV